MNERGLVTASFAAVALVIWLLAIAGLIALVLWDVLRPLAAL